MELKENFSLKKYNTFGVDAVAKYFVDFTTVESLKNILAETKNERKLILGGGSNILLTRNYDGVVMKNSIPGIDVVKEDETYIYLRAGAGVNWHAFVMYCVEKNLAGVENLSLIPGSVGASPMQNIGAYGVEVKDVFHELEALNVLENTVQKFINADCEFGYRESVFKKKYRSQFVILNVTFRLRKEPVFTTSYGAIREELEKMKVNELTIKAISDAVIAIRRSKLPDPALIGNAGSFFKNPVVSTETFSKLQHEYPLLPNFLSGENLRKIPAGWLIEQCGWKGYRKGDAGCYNKQALVLVNYGNANGDEIYKLSEEIKNSVKEKFGISLETEVNIK